MRPPSSNLAYPVILVPEAGRAISYTRQNPLTLYTWRYWFLKLGELLAMQEKIVRPPGINPVYLALLVLEAINSVRAISYARQNRTPT